MSEVDGREREEKEREGRGELGAKRLPRLPVRIFVYTKPRVKYVSRVYIQRHPMTVASLSLSLCALQPDRNSLSKSLLQFLDVFLSVLELLSVREGARRKELLLLLVLPEKRILHNNPPRFQ